MYKRFYNLQRNPFEITPDPSFLFATKKHNEALAALYYGVRRRKGFVVMTGEVGTGKTLLIRCLLNVLNRANVAFAYVFNPRLSPVEFLQYIVGDFRLVVPGKTKSDLLRVLNDYVISRHQKGLTTVLVVDEAHHLSTDVLEEIRLLTNLETSEQKLLQILLVGQPELDDKLDAIELRQLKQRIALRSHLGALSLDETQGLYLSSAAIGGKFDSGRAFSARYDPRSPPSRPRDSAPDQHSLRKRSHSRIREADAGRDSRNRGGDCRRLSPGCRACRAQ